MLRLFLFWSLLALLACPSAPADDDDSGLAADDDDSAAADDDDDSSSLADDDDSSDDDDSATDEPVPVDALAVGQLVLTELMADPGPGCSDFDDPYLELLYLGSDGGDLRGLLVGYGTSSAQIAGPVPVNNGDLVLLAREPSSPCYGTTAHPIDLEVWAVGGTITFTTPSGTELDAVDMGGWTIPDGASLQLSPGAMSAGENDLEANWCLSTSLIGGSGDLGTPGAPNTGC